MKIKIIELLNLVYEKKAPKKILYKHCEYKFCEENNDYVNKNNLNLFEYLFKYENEALNLEVEIIEERPKKIEKVNIEYDNKEETCKLAYANSCYELNPQEVIILDKIEEIRKATNYLLKKEDDKK